MKPGLSRGKTVDKVHPSIRGFRESVWISPPRAHSSLRRRPFFRPGSEQNPGTFTGCHRAYRRVPALPSALAGPLHPGLRSALAAWRTGLCWRATRAPRGPRCMARPQGGPCFIRTLRRPSCSMHLALSDKRALYRPAGSRNSFISTLGDLGAWLAGARIAHGGRQGWRSRRIAHAQIITRRATATIAIFRRFFEP